MAYTNLTNLTLNKPTPLSSLYPGYSDPAYEANQTEARLRAQRAKQTLTQEQLNPNTAPGASSGVSPAQQDWYAREKDSYARQRQTMLDAQDQQRYQASQNRNEIRYQDLQRVMTGLTSDQHTTGNSGVTGGQTISAPTAPNTEAIDTAATAAQNSAFGRAKATAGSLGRASVDTLRGEMADRGIVGGGTEARGLTDRLASATNPLSDLNTSALHENVGIAQHNQDLSSEAAKTGYEGAITQRGQDIAAQTAKASLDQQRRLSITQMLGNALNGLNRSY